MGDLLIYWFGAVVLMALLLAATVALGCWLYKAAEKTSADILRYRRLAWLRYWAQRCEREGLLRIDHHYRAVTQGRAPATVDEAHEWEDEADKSDARETS